MHQCRFALCITNEIAISKSGMIGPNKWGHGYDCLSHLDEASDGLSRLLTAMLVLAFCQLVNGYGLQIKQLVELS